VSTTAKLKTKKLVGLEANEVKHYLIKNEVFLNASVTGVAWLSSVRIVRSEVNSANGRNPCC